MTKVNVILLGNPGVGKSSIIQSYFGNFKPYPHMSVGVDHYLKSVDVEGVEVQLDIFDTPVLEKFKAYTPDIIRKAQVCIFVADVTSDDSFRDIQSWDEILEKCNGNAEKILAINKIDENEYLKEDVTHSIYDGDPKNELINDIKKLLKDYQNNIWVSAKRGTDIDSLFEFAATLGYNRLLFGNEEVI